MPGKRKLPAKTYYANGKMVRSTHTGFTSKRFRKGYDRTSGFYGRYTGQNQERKFRDTDVNFVTTSPGGAIFASVLPVGQGTSPTNRIGRKITLVSIAWRFRIGIINTLSPSETSDTFRVILYLDKQTNGAAPIVTDILTTNDYQSFNNLVNKGRFRTLMDRTYNMNAAAGVDRFGDHATNDAFYKKCNIPVEYDGVTGTLVELKSNNIGVLVLTAGGHCDFASTLRIRYTDM